MPLGMLVEGKWVNEEKDRDSQGNFKRTPTKFRNWISADGSSGFPAEPGRYHLYVSLACPWAQRTLIMRQLKGLTDAITLSIVDPEIDQDGWVFSEGVGCIPDMVNHAHYLRDIYIKAEPRYTGKVTVPVLWDKQRETIVNNESREIIRMFDTEFDDYAKPGTNFYPLDLQATIDQTIDAIYTPINNGVYRAGFATTQEAYEAAVTELFQALEH